MSEAVKPTRRSLVSRAIVRGVIHAVWILLLLGIPSALLWLNLAGFPRGVTERVAEALGGGQMSVEIDRLRLNPVRGIIGEGVRARSLEGVEIAVIDRVVIGLDLSALARRQVQVETLELAGASLQIPTGGEGFFVLTEVHAKAALLPGRFQLTVGSFLFENWRVTLQGTLLHPEKFDPAGMGGVGDEGDLVDTVHQAVVGFLKEVSFPDGPPSVDVHFSGDLADLSTIAADELIVDSGPLHWDGARLRSLQLVASYRKGRLSIESLDIEDDAGSLHAIGNFSDVNSHGSFLARSTLDILPWLQGFLGDVVPEILAFDQPPDWELTGELDWSGEKMDYRLMGAVHLRDFQVDSVSIQSLTGDFAIRPDLWISRGAELRSEAVNAKIDGKVEGRHASLRAEGAILPPLLMDVLDEGMRRIFGEMEFEEPGSGGVSIEWDLDDSSSIKGKGKLRLGRTAMRGSWIDSATSDFEIQDRAVTYSNMEVRIGDGVGTGTFVYDFGNREVRLEKIRSTLVPREILLWIDEPIAEAVAPYRFRGNPRVLADGTVDMEDPTKTKLDLDVHATEGLEYDLLGKTLEFGETQALVRVRGRALEADIPNAELFSGRVVLRTRVDLSPDPSPYELSLEVEDVDFARLTALYFDYTDSTGKLDGRLDYRAPMDDSTLLEGEGFLQIREGDVFAIPIFGPFSGILNSLVPGMGYHTASNATSHFQIANRVISTEDLEIVGNGFSLYGEGDIYFIEDRLDLAIRLNARGIPGVVLFPVSKLFEYTSHGSLSQPDWRPRNVPKELYGEGLLETITAPLRDLIPGFGGEADREEPPNSQRQGKPQRPRRGAR